MSSQPPVLKLSFATPTKKSSNNTSHSKNLEKVNKHVANRHVLQQPGSIQQPETRMSTYAHGYMPDNKAHQSSDINLNLAALQIKKKPPVLNLRAQTLKKSQFSVKNQSLNTNNQSPKKRPIASNVKSVSDCQKIVNYVLDKYGCESSCILQASQAIADLTSSDLNEQQNILEFKLPKNNTGIYIIKFDIIRVVLDYYLMGGKAGEHLLAFAIVYDSNTQEYQILSAAHNSYMLKEYYYGKIMPIESCDFVKFPYTHDMKNHRDRMDMSSQMVIEDIKRFKEYYSHPDFPRKGYNLGNIIKILQKVSSQKGGQISQTNNSTNRALLSLVIGYEAYYNNPDDITTTFFEKDYDTESVFITTFAMNKYDDTKQKLL